jgi:predicted nucleotidyltransferase component of viral defense system
MKKLPINLAASVRQRLLNLSRLAKRDFQEVLTRFALERLLYRLGQTEYRDQFILKGALLFVLWSEEIHRFTQDLDLLGYGEPSVDRLVDVFRNICRAEVQDDGLVFEPDTVVARSIREENIYGGIRVTLRAQLEQARIPIQVDIGFGDAVVPDPEETDFPPLLDFPSPHLRAYRRETSIAEKFLALVTLGQDNSRMKDYFDIWLLARDFAFEGTVLRAAMKAAFTRRNVPVPEGVPIGLTVSFAEDASKRSQWEAFVRRRVVTPEASPSLPEVTAKISDFLLPPLQAIWADLPFIRFWPARWPVADRE